MYSKSMNTKDMVTMPLRELNVN